MKVLIRLIASAVAACAVFCAHASAAGGRSVRDFAEVLDTRAAAALEQKIEHMETAGGPAVAVLTVPTLKGEDPDAFFVRQAKAWGHPGNSRGVLIGVATEEHKIRLEVSRSLDDALPPDVGQAIAHDVMAPRLRAGDYVGGIEAALDAIGARTAQPAAVPEAVVPSKEAALPPAEPASAQVLPAALETASSTLQNVIGVLLGIVGLSAAVCVVFRKVFGDETQSYTSTTYGSSSTSTPTAQAMSGATRNRPRDDGDVLRTAATVYAVDRMTSASSRDDSPSIRYDDSSSGGSSWSSDYSSSSSSNDYSTSGSDY